ncbi:hypothetical protein [Sphaerimonospora mesophila]|uniref:hypothetical protein n=1 Tax=Sphaerimonospora mesophila TaxID=37483 RepID=UPI00128EDF92
MFTERVHRLPVEEAQALPRRRRDRRAASAIMRGRHLLSIPAGKALTCGQWWTTGVSGAINAV